MKGEGNDVCLQCTCVRCSQILEYVQCDRVTPGPIQGDT